MRGMSLLATLSVFNKDQVKQAGKRVSLGLSTDVCRRWRSACFFYG